MGNSQFFSNCTADTIREAAAALKAGHLVAFPTETVYGLGADARNPEAVKRIYAVKGRPSDHPLIVHISSINHLDKWATEIPEYAIDLARAFWPGPMTLILKRTEIAKDFITGGQDTVGLRVPSDPIALALLQEFEKISNSAIAAPSANRFGQVSATSAQDVEEEIGSNLVEGDLILNGGQSSIGIESTIIDARNNLPTILRAGAISLELMRQAIDLDFVPPIKNGLRVSGGLKRHYAPNAKVILNQVPRPGQAFIAMSHIHTPKGVHRIAAPATVEEFARELYSGMREADKRDFLELVIITPNGAGLEVAILDRVEKSSKGRSGEAPAST
jgi:L-threonylcarbamoyladenylate synthase